MHLGQITKLLDYSARHDTIRILRAWPLKPARNPSTQKHFSFHLNLRLCTLPKRLFYSLSLHMILFFPGFLSVQTVFVSTQGTPINYVVSKLEISDPLPPLSSFLLSRVYLVNRPWTSPCRDDISTYIVYGRPLMSELYYGTVIQALSNNKAGMAVTYYYRPFKGCHRIGISTSITFNSLHQIVHKNVLFCCSKLLCIFRPQVYTV